MKNLLIVGGAVRNVGKTTLAEKIVKKFGKKHCIISLKIKTIYPNDVFFHGKDRNPLSENEKYRISEKSFLHSEGDSERMLKAGAEKSFMIKSKADFLKDAFNEFVAKTDKNCLIVCESNSLRSVTKPSLYLFIKPENSEEMKPSAEKLIGYADKIILTDGKKHDIDIESLYIENNVWCIKD